ncbi:MAG: hypothetical protein GY760_12590 [Deltaproteobacteria bacterium]|nr:hypothetical protein [Deltaproteobacteria bacterium]
MKCFNHIETDAVGICKHCSRALCKECCLDLGHGLSCKNHEDEVEAIKSLIDNNKLVYESQPKARMIVPVFSIFMGLVFAYFGYQRNQDLSLILGSGFTVFGIVIFVYNTINIKKMTTKYKD